MKVRTLVSTLALIAVLAPGVSLAQGPGGGGGPGGGAGGGAGMGPGAAGMGSGMQDRTQDRLRDPTMDADRDRDRDRLYAAATDRLQDRDRDRDGVMSGGEHEGWAQDVFGAMDANRDGRLSREEYMGVRMGPGPKAGISTQRQAQMQERAEHRKTLRFQVMDSDGDGLVARGQFMAQSRSDFADSDQNDDGKVTVQEFSNWRRGM